MSIKVWFKKHWKGIACFAGGVFTAITGVIAVMRGEGVHHDGNGDAGVDSQLGRIKQNNSTAGSILERTGQIHNELGDSNKQAEQLVGDIRRTGQDALTDTARAKELNSRNRDILQRVRDRGTIETGGTDNAGGS